MTELVTDAPVPVGEEAKVETVAAPSVEGEEDELPLVEDVNRGEDAIRRDGQTQGEYYSKWDKFADLADKAIEQDDANQTEQADRELGRNKYARSEAEKKDTTTNKALKEAKKLWDQRRALDEGAKHDITESSVNRVLDQCEFEGKRVLRFKSCEDATFELPAGLEGMIKVFIESCTNCTFNVRCKLVTAHLEIAHADRVTCNLDHSDLRTVQVDLSQAVTLRFADHLLHEDVQRIYHAGVRDLNVFGVTPHGHLSAHADYVSDGAGNNLPEEQPFITQVVAGELLTEKAMRVGNRFVTQRELDLETDVAAAVTQREREELALQAERSKLAGNQAFQNAEYAQAAVHYTMAIDQAGTAGAGLAAAAEAAAGEGGEGGGGGAACSPNVPASAVPATLVVACYSNRAACWLKLGQHEKALEDAESCIRLDETFVKGHFRKGLSLHAMKRYREALPCLGRALDLESPDKKKAVAQIKDAIRFAEAKFAMSMRGP